MDPTFAFAGLDPVHAWPALAPLLPADYRHLAVEHRQVQTQFGNAKITSADDLLRFVFAYAGANAPLRQVVAEMEAAGAAKLSAMRLHMKLRQAAPYLHALCQSLVPARLGLAPDAWRGFEALHVAGARVVGPSSTQVLEGLHVATALADVRVDAVAMTDPSERDGLRQFFWLPKQIAIASAAAATPASVARAGAQGAYVLLDLAESALAFTDALGGAVDARAFLRGVKRAPSAERDVRLVSEPSRRVDGRLVAFAPKGGGAPRVVFTTVPEALLPRPALVTLAERAAGVAASLGGWRREGARLSNQRDDTTRAWVYARILLGLLEQKVSAQSA